MPAQYARRLQDTGAFDQFALWDQMNNWFPANLWTLENSPVAGIVPDLESLQDPFTTAAFALSDVDKLGFSVCTDAVRRDPPELAQTMLSLSTATEGQTTLHLGAGEIRHIGPFGRKRSLGLKRLNETLQILRLLWTAEGPADFDGEVWKLKDAWIGNAGKEKRPEVLALGGGPRLIEMAMKYADGFSTGVPFVYCDPKEYGAALEGYRKRLVELGRDPEKFTFAAQHICFIVKDKDEFEKYVDNPLVKWYAGTVGRINMNDWAKEGEESVFPLDWHYAVNMKPNSTPADEVNEIVANVTPEMVRKTFFYGTPDEIAAEIKPFVEQGASLNLIADVSALVLPVDPEASIEASAEISRLVKGG
jgi:phthiodiolone/phenolphthiodiolone dimycocerosates ketoreductase